MNQEEQEGSKRQFRPVFTFERNVRRLLLLVFEDRSQIQSQSLIIHRIMTFFPGTKERRNVRREESKEKKYALKNFFTSLEVGATSCPGFIQWKSVWKTLTLSVSCELFLVSIFLVRFFPSSSFFSCDFDLLFFFYVHRQCTFISWTNGRIFFLSFTHFLFFFSRFWQWMIEWEGEGDLLMTCISFIQSHCSQAVCSNLLVIMRQ